MFCITILIKGTPTQGIHVLSIRVKDENGAWGNTFSKAIMVNPALSTRDIKIQAAEYFWDIDPGQGSGTALVAFDGNFNQAIESVFDSSSLKVMLWINLTKTKGN